MEAAGVAPAIPDEIALCTGRDPSVIAYSFWLFINFIPLSTFIRDVRAIRRRYEHTAGQQDCLWGLGRLFIWFLATGNRWSLYVDQLRKFRLFASSKYHIGRCTLALITRLSRPHLQRS